MVVVAGLPLRYCFFWMMARLALLLLIPSAAPPPGRAGVRGRQGLPELPRRRRRQVELLSSQQDGAPGEPRGSSGRLCARRIKLRGETYGFQAKDGKYFKYFITESKLLGKKTGHQVLYTLENRRIQHYLTTLPDGRVVVLPPAWDILRKEWVPQHRDRGPRARGRPRRPGSGTRTASGAT